MLNSIIKNNKLFFYKDENRTGSNHVVEISETLNMNGIDIIFFKDYHNKNAGLRVLSSCDFAQNYEKVLFNIGDTIINKQNKKEYLINSINIDGYGYKGKNDTNDTFFFWSAHSYAEYKEEPLDKLVADFNKITDKKNRTRYIASFSILCSTCTRKNL